MGATGRGHSETVCHPSGPATPYCPTKQELFRAGTEPTTYDTIYQPFQINRETGLLATVYTPADLIEERVFQIYPPEAADWVREAGFPQPPTEYDTVGAPNALGPVDIAQPRAFHMSVGCLSQAMLPIPTSGYIVCTMEHESTQPSGFRSVRSRRAETEN
jgi:hypothetical protein